MWALNTGASQQEGPGFDARLKACLCRVCVFSLCFLQLPCKDMINEWMNFPNKGKLISSCQSGELDKLFWICISHRKTKVKRSSCEPCSPSCGCHRLPLLWLQVFLSLTWYISVPQNLYFNVPHTHLTWSARGRKCWCTYSNKTHSKGHECSYYKISSVIFTLSCFSVLFTSTFQHRDRFQNCKAKKRFGLHGF